MERDLGVVPRVGGVAQPVTGAEQEPERSADGGAGDGGGEQNRH